ncbi:MAG: ABC transporter permease [Candidatus Aminicenantes bacterium]|nr:ABC transporter permease [Candidatus Aminicenantes bacterium]
MDYDFFEIFDIDLVQGRTFSRDFAADKQTAWIVNEEAVKAMGMKDPVGKKMFYKGEGTIIGVMKNYHYATLRDEIGPLVLNLEPENIRYVVLKVNPKNIADTKKRIEKIWNVYDPDQIFEAELFEDILEEAYFTESIISKFFNYAAYISLLISCLGLFGLTAYSVEQRLLAAESKLDSCSEVYPR